MKKILTSMLVVASFVLPTATYAYTFTVSDIRVNGLERVSPGNVYNAFPISIGESVDDALIADAIKALFATGYFKDIQIGRDGSAIVVNLIERPTIASLEIQGNSSIQTEDLKKGLQQSGLAEGLVLRRSTLERIKVELERQYSTQGRYDSSIKTTLKSLPRNRVAVTIDINEGNVAAIKHVNIVGNKVFPDSELLDLFTLKPTNFWSFYKSDDKYSKEKLGGDIERLRSYYLDRGYIKFNVESTQVSIGPNKKDIYITVNVSEGDKYSIKETKLAGDLVVKQKELKDLIVIDKGDTYSRQTVNFVSDLITKRLGNEGFTFANVNVIPEVSESDKTVGITYFVVPGKRTYVRQVNFRGNTSTADEVLRRELVQMEGGWASTEKINRSREKIDQLGFFKGVNVKTPTVPGTEDQIDVEYVVEEQPNGNLNFSLGYSGDQGFLIGASIDQKNFLGSGKNINTSINSSKTRQRFSFSYLNPYFTLDGVSRGYNFFFQKEDFDELADSRFETNTFGGAVRFGYPIGKSHRLNFSVGYKNTEVIAGGEASDEIRFFTQQNGGDTFDEFNLIATWVNSTLNRGIFATKGHRQTINLETSVPGSDLEYYKVSYNGQKYFPLSDSLEWAIRIRTEIGYGEGYGDDPELPFYENFRAGGISSVRGFSNSTLGPRGSQEISNLDRDNPLDRTAYGGNAIFESGIELIFPAPFLKDRRSVRTLVYLDGGNVFDTNCLENASILDNDGNARIVTNEECLALGGINFDNLRYGAGFGLSWLTAIGPLTFSYSFPLNEEEEDDTEGFEFTLGQTF